MIVWDCGRYAALGDLSLSRGPHIHSRNAVLTRWQGGEAMVKCPPPPSKLPSGWWLAAGGRTQFDDRNLAKILSPPSAHVLAPVAPSLCNTISNPPHHTGDKYEE